MGDLIGDTLESLVGGAPFQPQQGPAADPAPLPKAGSPAAAPSADNAPSTAAPAGTEPRPSTAREIPPGGAGPRGASADLHLQIVRPVLQRGSGRVFAVASGKGGTGKSLLAVNLAVAMADTRQVSLIDADFGLANAHILMGLLPRSHIGHLLWGQRSLDDVVLEGPKGISLLPGACGVPEMTTLDDDHLDLFATMTAPLIGRCDAVILDCPAGLTRQSLLFLHASDVVVVVTTEELTSMTDAYALIKTLLAHRPQATLGLVVNDARTVADGSETYRKICHVTRKFLGKDLLSLGTVPHDPLLERSVTERRPLVTSHPSSPAARAILDLADRLTSLRGLEPTLGFPERVRRILSRAPATGARLHGDRPCAS
jgi:flagellar biosynthesis protein FlhG